MNENNHEDRLSVYEIGYLIASSIPEEKIPAEAEAVRKIIEDAGASIIADEAPRHQPLAYTIRRKTSAGSYEKHDEAYFGWIKFELGSDKVEAVKKAVELVPSVLRMLLMTTVRESTYLGKRASAVAASFGVKKPMGESVEMEAKKDIPPAAPATIEEMDKSIDEMVKAV